MDYNQFRTTFHEVLDVAGVEGFFQFSVISHDDTFERDTDNVVRGDAGIRRPARERRQPGLP